MKKKIGIITGASSGLGREFVIQLDKSLKQVDELWVIARRKEHLESLREVATHIPLRILPFDLCNASDLDKLTNMLEEECPSVRVLVNAAGIGRTGRFDEITRKEAENMVSLNAQALVSITHIVLPYMHVPSHIIQMASASAFFPQKEFAVYAASKTFVLHFSKALQKEVKEDGITVTIVCPGPVDTAFLEIANAGRQMKPLKRLTMVKPENVVKKALKDAKAGKKLSIYGLPMNVVYWASRIL